MKKSKILIPLASLTMLCTSAIPLASCGCSQDPEPEPTPTEDEYCTYTKLEDGTYEASTCKQTGEKVIVPEKFNNINVTSVGEKFCFCNRDIKTLILPSTVKTIKASAFMNCSNLSSISFNGETNAEPQIETICTSAFCGCWELKFDVIPSSIKTIESFAFQYCRSITTLYIPSNVTTIGVDAFNGCNNAVFLIQAQTIPEGWDAKWNSSHRPFVTDWDAEWKIQQFTDTNGVVYNYLPFFNDSAIILYAENFNDLSGELVIPSKVVKATENGNVEYEVVKLHSKCFASSVSNSKVKSIVINNSIKLGSDCFEAFICANIYSKGNIDDSWKTEFESKNDRKAYGSLRKIEIDTTTNFRYIQNANNEIIIIGCDETKTFGEVVIPATIDGKAVIEIAPRSFNGIDLFEKITFECDSCVVGAYAFYNCRKLWGVVLDNVTYIGKRAFNITALKSITENGVETATINDGKNKLTYIGESAFEKPYLHKTEEQYEYTILITNLFSQNNSITHIGDGAFKNVSIDPTYPIYLNDSINKFTGCEFNKAGYDGYDQELSTPVKFYVSQTLFDLMTKNAMEGGWGWRFVEHTGDPKYYILDNSSNLGIGHVFITE